MRVLHFGMLIGKSFLAPPTCLWCDKKQWSFFLQVWKYILQASQRLEYLFSTSTVNNSWKKWFSLLTKWKYLQRFFNSSSLPFWKLHSKNFIYKKKRDSKNVKKPLHPKNGVFLLYARTLKFLLCNMKDTTERSWLFYQKVLVGSLLRNLKRTK